MTRLLLFLCGNSGSPYSELLCVCLFITLPKQTSGNKGSLKNSDRIAIKLRAYPRLFVFLALQKSADGRKGIRDLSSLQQLTF